MENQLKTPDKLNFEVTDLAHTWKKWKEEFSLYAELALDGKDDKFKVKMFKYLIGSRGREVYDTLTFAETENDRTVDIVLQKFDTYCNPLKNETVERYKFNSRTQQSGESVSKYYTELKLIAAHCGYGALEESLIRDQIVCGIKDTQVRERLLRDSKLTLKGCLDTCRATELSKERIKEIENSPAEVHAVKSPSHGASARHKNNYETPKSKIDCRYCGRKHEPSKQKCPAYGQSCRKCNKKDHFAAVCGRNKPQQHKSRGNQRNQRVNLMCDDEDSDEYYETIKTVTGTTTKHVYATMNVNDRPIKFQIDSGASCNVIPMNKLKGLECKIVKSSTVLTTYDNSEIRPLGKTTLKLVNAKNGKSYAETFIVVKEKHNTNFG
ncbi:Hypothetical predicted protein [Mytilus galloprovincialis]|uniref:Retrotransposon gag domain-containing protein n=1 Tax=Mytilus galloprovincialis TaxID=29158 RepID=A0A8B6FC17_MYTGA|nr:Hypothetical predicted protein [Mytilus galloprovincialis]